jgi:6-phosphogluconate dehydrogenase
MDAKHEIGIIGLGVMGHGLLLNMSDHGHPVAGFDKDPGKTQKLEGLSEEKSIRGAKGLEEFVNLLRRPRAVLMLVPAGGPVDSAIEDLLPFLEEGDIVIDAGNSRFLDTDRRAEALARKGLRYLGVGISGGEEGARHGPSIMPGGPREAYDRVERIFLDVAAKVDGEACVTYLGPGSAGHYVKMVHNGIEYGLMQLIAETYDLMKRGLGLSNEALAEIYGRWNQGELGGFLVEITSQVFGRQDDKTGEPLIDRILDAARQKGTGMWTSQDAMDLQVPVPTIDMAVAMRNLSAGKELWDKAARSLEGPQRSLSEDRGLFVDRLANALYAAMILTYAQGMAQLARASEVHQYHLRLEDVARIWQGGCIIRAELLKEIRGAYRRTPDLACLLLDAHLGRAVAERQANLRAVIATGVERGIPVPGLMASLSYYDAVRSAWLPANLIQAQRDFFGAHTYERIDEAGTFHTKWQEEA